MCMKKRRGYTYQQASFVASKVVGILWTPIGVGDLGSIGPLLKATTGAAACGKPDRVAVGAGKRMGGRFRV